MGAAQACCQGGSQRLVLQSTSLLYLDRDVENDRGSAKARSRDSSTPRIVSGKLRGVPILRVPSSAYPWTASSIERSEVDEFKHMLGSHGIDTTCWGSQGAKAVEQLFWEIFYQHGSILTGIGTGKLKRVTRILKLRILAEINGIDHVMVSRLQFMHDGQQIQRQQLPLRRLCWKMPSDNALLQSCEINLCDENNEYAESWRSCWPSVLEDRLGICSSAFQHQLDEVTSAYSYHTEDNVHSEGYPGLKTLYCVHQVTFRVTNPAHSKVACIGLPLGQDFATANDNFCLERDILDLVKGRHSEWAAVSQDCEEAQVEKNQFPSALLAAQFVRVDEFEDELMMRKRVPISASMSKLASMDNVAHVVAPVAAPKKTAPNAKLRRVLSSKRTDWRTVRKIASNLLDKNYTLSQFMQDLAAFPELSLYLRDGAGLDIDGRQGFCFGTDETWTALKESAVQIGGRLEGIARYLDGGWAGFPQSERFRFGPTFAQFEPEKGRLQYLPPSPCCLGTFIFGSVFATCVLQAGACPCAATAKQRLGRARFAERFCWCVDSVEQVVSSHFLRGEGFYQLERRLAFFNNAQWSFFRRLMVDAGLLEASFQNGRNTFRVKETRMVSLLALTAIHDIMKIENLLPTVQPEHDGYHGYAAGDVIGDHDHALCYVMVEAAPKAADCRGICNRGTEFGQSVFIGLPSKPDVEAVCSAAGFADVRFLPSSRALILDTWLDFCPWPNASPCRLFGGSSRFDELEAAMSKLAVGVKVGQALVKLTKLYQAGGEFAFREAAPASIWDSLLDATGPSGSGPVSLDGGPSLRGTLLTGESYERRFAQRAHPRILDARWAEVALHHLRDQSDFWEKKRQNWVGGFLVWPPGRTRLTALVSLVLASNAERLALFRKLAVSGRLLPFKDHYPDLLPSFKDLDPAERQSVQFTQCNLCFNHGWLVQAEAPAGAIFSKFREAVARDRRVQGGARDIALYFVHWLTDLAGAEPTPLGGCEKFVIKFPLHVLNSFLQSFKFIEGISVRTETQVMEKYLKYRWSDHVPTLGEPPKGPHAIAAMRLLCMAQANGRTIVDAFNQELSSEDKEVLSVEMSRTGCAGQFFSPELTPSEVISKAAGPAFLVYYGPAFLQALGSDSAVLRLRVLSEIYRCAREIWPESEASVAVSVHVRIDTIKGLAIRDIQDVLTRGDLWLVTKHNESEAFVERASHGKLNRLVRGCQKFQVLDLGFLRDTRNI
ncbi:hypothetical protein AK812_SmicGene43263 [Symbiodinium microadriaticum]|uniref:Uncharacterized protein n=1 Tax=Symbiodinium microadriaticum TaxID=2951 RepID=A0A1Q9C1G6_SYMMI|nr:hypothetical protein AK812_SmicGene43263 [Symbiodinium microadriaticum]